LLLVDFLSFFSLFSSFPYIVLEICRRRASIPLYTRVSICMRVYISGCLHTRVLCAIISHASDDGNNPPPSVLFPFFLLFLCSNSTRTAFFHSLFSLVPFSFSFDWCVSFVFGDDQLHTAYTHISD
jgi:hypothetical protein